MKTTAIFDKLDIDGSAKQLQGIIKHTPLQYNEYLSENLSSNIFMKREDMQVVRSYKLRGAYNKINSLSSEQLLRGIVCASAGNHAQGVAYSCFIKKVKGVIFMPKSTPKQKIKQTQKFGKEFVEIVLTGDTFDSCATTAITYTAEHNMTFISPFDDIKVIEGQGTIGKEILEDSLEKIDYIFIPVGGGGLCSGVGSYIKQKSPDTKIIAVEPAGAASLKLALTEGKPTKLEHIDKFVDGAAVQKIGDIPYEICKVVVDEVCLIPEGEVCTAILSLYNLNGIVVEPAGALSIAALNHYKEEIKGKNVICIISGGNNDIDRMQEIKERSLIFEGLKHYFIVTFAQRNSALKDFINHILGPMDNIVRFEYMKKNDKEHGPALVAIEFDNYTDYETLVARMNSEGIDYSVLDPNSSLGSYII